MTIEEIIKAFSYVEKGVFPKEALNEAIAKQEEITPILLEYISHSPAEIDKKMVETENTADFMWFFSMFLLAQFREQKAFPFIVKFFSDEDQEMVDAVASDFITESLPAVLASTFNGDIDALIEVINNEDFDEFIRGSFLQATVILIIYDILKLDDLRPRYIEILEREMNKEECDFDFISECVNCLAKLADPLLRPYIDRAFDEEYVIPVFMGKDELEEDYKNPTKPGDTFYSLITDTYEELSSWAWFRDRDYSIPEDFDDFFGKSFGSDAQDDFDELPDNELNYAIKASDGTYSRDTPKVGRNDPCPCGSGKKYKKCCLGKG